MNLIKIFNKNLINYRTTKGKYKIIKDKIN
jgi:hypothetical protein